SYEIGCGQDLGPHPCDGRAAREAREARGAAHGQRGSLVHSLRCGATRGGAQGRDGAPLTAMAMVTFLTLPLALLVGRRMWLYVLICGAETTTDAAQALNFGVYRVYRWADDHRLLLEQEGLFYADDLPERDPTGYATLRAFAVRHDFEPQGTMRRWLSC